MLGCYCFAMPLSSVASPLYDNAVISNQENAKQQDQACQEICRLVSSQTVSELSSPTIYISLSRHLYRRRIYA